MNPTCAGASITKALGRFEMRLRFSLLAPSLVFISALAQSCEKRSAPTSEPKHAEGVFFPSPNPILWTAVTPDYVAADGEQLGPSHPATKWVQGYADHIHDAFVAKSGKGSLVPRPLVRLVEDERQNAHVNIAYNCVKADLSSESIPDSGAEDKEEGELYAFVSDSSNIEFSLERETDSLFCGSGTFEDNPGKIAGLVEFINAKKTPCTAKLKDGGIVATKECFPSDSPPARAKGIAFQASAAYITVYTGLLAAAKSNDEILFVIAHELAHYYMAHVVLPVSFHYVHAKANPRWALPQGDPELSEKYGDIQAVHVFHEIPKAVLAAPVFGMLSFGLSITGQVSKLSRSEESRANCLTFEKLMEEFIASSRYPYRPLPSHDHPKVFKIEQSFLSCAKGVPRSTESVAFLDEWRNQAMHPAYSRTLSTTWHPDRATMFDAVMDIDKSVRERRGALLELLKEAEEKKVGWYTDEQQADDLALELLNHAGVDPASGQKFFLRMLAEFGASGGGLDAEQCARLMKDRFRDGSGEFKFVPVGLWNDPHHSDCYRIANIDREIHAHHYDHTKSPLAERATKLLAQQKPELPNSAAGGANKTRNPAVRGFPLTDCRRRMR